MSSRKEFGDAGEVEVVALVPCPNCGKSLMQLPRNYPLFDVQCTGCLFRAQVKSPNTKPSAKILGAGWDIMEKCLKSGMIIPPLIINYKWNDKGIAKQEIRFHPFVPRLHLRKRQLSASAQRANYRMFNYVGLDKLPYLVLYSK